MHVKLTQAGPSERAEAALALQEAYEASRAMALTLMHSHDINPLKGLPKAAHLAFGWRICGPGRPSCQQPQQPHASDACTKGPRGRKLEHFSTKRRAPIDPILPCLWLQVSGVALGRRGWVLLSCAMSSEWVGFGWRVEFRLRERVPGSSNWSALSEAPFLSRDFEQGPI